MDVIYHGDSSYDNAHCPLTALTQCPGWAGHLYALCGHAVVQYTIGRDRIKVLAGSIGQSGTRRHLFTQCWWVEQ